MIVVRLWRKECCIDGDICDRFEIINIFVKFCVQYLFMFFHCCIGFVDVGRAHFVKANFIS